MSNNNPQKQGKPQGDNPQGGQQRPGQPGQGGQNRPQQKPTNPGHEHDKDRGDRDR